MLTDLSQKELPDEACLLHAFLNKDRLSAVDREAVRLSHMLSSSAYNFQTDLWRSAGWVDLAYDEGRKISYIEEETRNVFSLRIRETLSPIMTGVRRLNELGNSVRVIRSGEEQDCRFITMAKPVPEGKTLIAVGFTGTRQNLIDWRSNFRISEQNGLHKGFADIAEAFMKQLRSISYPETAARLGLSDLTLEDVLRSAARPDSPFRIWFSGHSQGSAVMQLVVASFLNKGAMPGNLIGVGFASPTVSYRPLSEEAPVVHFIASDDIVPRLGAKYHVGDPYIFPVSFSDREILYEGMDSDPVFLALLRMQTAVTDPRSCLCFSIACLEVLASSGTETALAFLKGFFQRENLNTSLLENRFGSVLGLCGRMAKRLRKEAAGIDSCPVTQTELAQFIPLIQSLLRHPQIAGSEMIRVLMLPHRLGEIDQKTAVYSYMLLPQNFFRCRPVYMMPGSWPCIRRFV